MSYEFDNSTGKLIKDVKQLLMITHRNCNKNLYKQK